MMPVRHKEIKSFDKTKIGYQVIGKGKKTIILCTGLGGSVIAWKPLYEFFGDKYKFISWDYRGLFRSDPPFDESKLTMKDHVADMKVILKRERISKALFCGWSMGVQICLEHYRNNPSDFSGMILMSGTSGHPFDTILDSPLSRFIFSKVNELSQKILPAIQPTIKPLVNWLIDWKGFINLIASLGLVHKNLDPEIFSEISHEMVLTDFNIYHEIMRHLSEHDASDILPKVKVPVLIIAGDRDKMTPIRVAEKMTRRIKKAELFVVPRGSHYCLLEFPEKILSRVKKFLEEHYPSPAT